MAYLEEGVNYNFSKNEVFPTALKIFWPVLKSFRATFKNLQFVHFLKHFAIISLALETPNKKFDLKSL